MKYTSKKMNYENSIATTDKTLACCLMCYCFRKNTKMCYKNIKNIYILC